MRRTQFITAVFAMFFSVSVAAETIKVTDQATDLPTWCSSTGFLVPIRISGNLIRYVHYDIPTRASTELELRTDERVIACDGKVILVIDQNGSGFRTDIARSFRSSLRLPISWRGRIEGVAVEGENRLALVGNYPDHKASSTTSVEFFVVGANETPGPVKLIFPAGAEIIDWGLPIWWASQKRIVLNGNSLDGSRSFAAIVDPATGVVQIVNLLPGVVSIEAVPGDGERLFQFSIGPNGRQWVACSIRRASPGTPCVPETPNWLTSAMMFARSISHGRFVAYVSSSNCIISIDSATGATQCLATANGLFSKLVGAYSLSPDKRWLAYVEMRKGEVDQPSPLRLLSLD